MKHGLPFIQSICLNLYISCKARSKKAHGLPLHEPGKGLTPDEELIHFMLRNSSITDQDSSSPRSFNTVNKAIHNTCKTLCPGPWCTRIHCKSYSGHCAYNCGAGKKPSICKEYKSYIEKKKERDARKESKKISETTK